MKIPSHSKAVIFDMDGLIIDSEPYWDKALVEMFQKRGRDCPQQALRDVHGMGPKESAQLLKDRYQMDGDVAALISEKKENFYNLFLKDARVLPGAREIIDKLYKLKYPLAIATMGHYRDKLELILTKLQLTKFFEVLVTSDEVKNGKPHPDVYIYTAEELGIPAKDCLVFEDAPSGVKAGKAAGMLVYGINKDEEIYIKLKEAGADEVFRSLRGNSMKVAIVHDYIKEYGGAERVLEELHTLYPDATVFTSVYLPKFLGPHKARFKNWKIKSSWFQYVPFNYKLISPFRLISARVFSQFDFSEFDVVIVSATGAYFPNAINKKSAVQICYCHTPPRYLYGYATAREWKKNKIFAFLAPIANHFLRMTDFNASKNVNFYMANSQEVAGRIKKFYRRDATVIYPPVSLQGLGTGEKGLKKEYFVTGGRLARAKHVDIIVEACSTLGVQLKVFGKSFAGYGEELQEKAGKTVDFLGEISDEEKNKLMAGAKAFLFASEDEDFGIIPVEALGAGLPVIAYKSGGVKETIIDGKTGVFFETLTVDSLVSAIKKFEKMKFDPKECKKQAEKFSKERFIREIQTYINSKIKI